MSNLWAVGLGVDFATGFVDGLLERHAGNSPEALARMTIYANSQRMRRRITDGLVARGVHVLPRLRLVADLADDLILADLPATAPSLRRRLQLNQLVAALIAQDASLAPASAVQDLTESLFALMEEMDSEAVEPGALALLDVSDHSEHWARSLRFLNILVPFFAGSGARGNAARQRIAAQRLAELWAAIPPQDPVIVAGSTASRGATSTFMAAVARLPQGAVVLPGFDFDQPPEVWEAMADAMTGEDHPQYRFLALAQRLGIGTDQVQQWTKRPAVDRARNQVLSLALRPAPVTDQWMTEGAKLRALPETLKNVALVEAPSPRHEALALALILRDSAERGQKAALITPDRLLARRVIAALDRWGARPDDSAGRPLILSAPGRFLRHVVDLFCNRLTAAQLLVLLKHPLVSTSQGRGPHLLLTRELELRLRRYGPMFPTLADLRKLGDRPGGAAWADGLAPLFDRLTTDRRPLADWVASHRMLAETLARGAADQGAGELWLENAGQACVEVFDQLTAEAPHGGEITALAYRDLFTALLAEKAVQDSAPCHENIQILGAREARECGAEVVVLAGLNEGSWPALPGPDPWLNRVLRRDLGLLLPERQIGLSAHDFQQAAAAPIVILSRSLRSDDAETVPARWLNRLTNLLDGLPLADGPNALRDMRKRGADWLNLAARLDQPSAADRADPGLRPALRPRPVPPASARPDRLSLTEIEKLIRDPYAIYARRILALTRLDPLNSEPDAGERGTLFHKILERFALERPPEEDAAAAKARLLATTAEVLTQNMPFPVHRALWMARMEGAADPLIEEDRLAGQTLAVERTGELEMDNTGVMLHGRLDRVDRAEDGTLVLIDYKTGQLPTKAQLKAFAKQLHATAVLVERGAFGLPKPLTVGEIRYVGVSEKGLVMAATLDEAMKSETWSGLIALLTFYRRGDTGFTARRAMTKTDDRSDFDHLSRFGEWDLSAPGQAVILGVRDAE